MPGSPRLVHTNPAPAWLPPGSTAEAWAGADLAVPAPTVIVRLAVFRPTALFCVRTPRGFDLPTLFLDGLPALAGVAQLTRRHLRAPATTHAPADPAVAPGPAIPAGASPRAAASTRSNATTSASGNNGASRTAGFNGDLPTRCIGFVRNVVPKPDETYRLPAPLAHVPVFTPRDAALRPAEGTGTWIEASEAPASLSERHWWPIVREALGPRADDGRRSL
ncbi:hypothetical protein AB0J83_48515 [Actinoplanes sp. NPDC049596]|uniref:hypothetical protein n=1 Tax=unclassified Actinoplanes TaxID=2626549 RepID=UPI00341E61A0